MPGAPGFLAFSNDNKGPFMRPAWSAFKPAKLARGGVLPLLLAALILNACEGVETERVGEILTAEEERKRGQGKLFGDLTIGGPAERQDETSGIGVNGFLWRASLDTVSFLPLSSADPFGGVIITDWYTPPESPRERFKVNVFILGKQLRSDGIRVAVFRQELRDGNWADAEVADGAATKLEDAILTRAREIRIAQNDE